MCGAAKRYRYWCVCKATQTDASFHTIRRRWRRLLLLLLLLLFPNVYNRPTSQSLRWFVSWWTWGAVNSFFRFVLLFCRLHSVNIKNNKKTNETTEISGKRKIVSNFDRVDWFVYVKNGFPSTWFSSFHCRTTCALHFLACQNDWCERNILLTSHSETTKFLVLFWLIFGSR